MALYISVTPAGFALIFNPYSHSRRKNKVHHCCHFRVQREIYSSGSSLRMDEGTFIFFLGRGT